MKKQLLVGAFMLASFLTAKAQSTTYNFNDLNVGNLGTDITGETAGQGGWYTVASNGAAGTTTTNFGDNTVFQVIASDETHVNALQVAGPNGSAGYAAAFRAEVADAWEDRTEGNDVQNVSFEYYTGTAVTGTQNFFSVATYSAVETADDTPYVLGGFIIDKATRAIYAQAYLAESDDQDAGNYFLSFSSTSTPVTLPENKWVKLTYSYNSKNGDIYYRAEVDGQVAFTTAFTGAGDDSIGQTPGDVDVESFSVKKATTDPANTVGSTSIVDNLIISTDATTLGVKPVVAAKFAVFPNPTSGVVTVANADASINAVSVTDINGRTVKSVKVGGVASTQVNISDLASGVYMMSIASDKGTSTQKIIKN